MGNCCKKIKVSSLDDKKCTAGPVERLQKRADEEKGVLPEVICFETEAATSIGVSNHVIQTSPKSVTIPEISCSTAIDINNLPPELVEQILQYLPIKFLYTSIRHVCLKWNRLAARFCRNVQGLCLSDRCVEILFHRRPTFDHDSFLLENRMKELIFFFENTSHRIFSVTKKREFCRSLLRDSSGKFVRSVLIELTGDGRSERDFCFYLIRHSNDNFETLHFAYKQDCKADVAFVFGILQFASRHCRRLKSLQMNRFLFKALRDSFLDYFYELLPILSGLDECVITNGPAERRESVFDASGQVARNVAETVLATCNGIRKLDLDNIDLGAVSYFKISQLRLYRFSFSLVGNAHMAGLFDCFTASFETLVELKLSLLLLIHYQQDLNNGLEYIRAMPNLEQFSVGYQEGGKFCIFAGHIARALSEGFPKLKNLTFESLRYDQLSHANFSPNGNFLNNVSSRLVSLTIRIVNGADVIYCGGDLGLWVSEKMPHLQTLIVDGWRMHPRFNITNFIVNYCPNLAYLEIYDYDKRSFPTIVQNLHARLHICKICSSSCVCNQNRPSDSRTLNVSTPCIMDRSDRIVAANKCGLTISKNSNKYIANIDRYCSNL